MVSHESQNKKSSVLVFLLFLGAGTLLFLYMINDSSTRMSASKAAATLKNPNYEKAVNRHLMFTNEKIKLEKKRAQLENEKLFEVGTKANSYQNPYANDDKLDLNGDSYGKEVATDIKRGPRQEEILGPDDMIQKELFNQQQMAEYSQAYREEYARVFIENARRGGFKVILSEDLSRVISVVPVAPRAGLEIFPGSGSTR